MQVVSWNRNTAQVQNGITLKTIEPSRLNGLKEDAKKAAKMLGADIRYLF